MQLSQQTRDERKRIHDEIIDAFGKKYSWLGSQASREMLMSAASWNIEKHSNPPFRYRTHLMLMWKRGWVKSTLLRKMADILPDDFCSTIGKVSDAAFRGSISGGQFTPPKPLKSPIVISTEFGQTNFDDELLGVFLALLEEGETNVALNKVAQLGVNEKKKIAKDYEDNVEFGESNEFTVKTDFIFWGATHDPQNLSDDGDGNALLSRFNVVTPAKPLEGKITQEMDSSGSVNKYIDSSTVKSLRREIKSDKKVETDFTPPSKFYKKYNLNPRESRDVQSYMACRNWWGLEVNPQLMEKYIQYMQSSRKRVMLSTKERIFRMILDNPMSYNEIMNKIGLSHYEVYKVLNTIGAKQAPVSNSDNVKWVIYSGESDKENIVDDKLSKYRLD